MRWAVRRGSAFATVELPLAVCTIICADGVFARENGGV